MRRSRWIVLAALMGCQATVPIVDADEAQPEAPEPQPATLDLPDDRRCAHPRQTRPDPAQAGDPLGDMIVEYLDDDGCVAVRGAQTVMGRTTRFEVEVPGDPQWFPQPPSYVDLTPRPQVTTVTVDAEGREVERTEDLGADGTIDVRARQVWQGEHLVEEVREGDPSWRQRWTYDARGNQVRYESVTLEQTMVIEREFDAQDRNVVERVLYDGELRSTHTRRHDGDLLLEDRVASAGRVEVTLYSYDADGTLRRREWRRDDRGSSVIVELHDFSENAEGEAVEHYRRDDRGDGQIDEQRWTVTDLQGRQRLVEHDDDADGSIDWSRSQRWDDEGRLIWWRNVQDGAPTLLRTWTFDEPVYEQTEWPAPGGQPGTWITRSWQDGDAQITEVTLLDRIETLRARTVTRYVTPDVIGEETTDRDGDGVVDLHLRQTVDALGRVTRTDWRRDGIATWRTFEYDQHGELARETGTLPSGGEAHLLQQFVRDAAGNVLYSYTLRPDGESAYRIVRAFD